MYDTQLCIISFLGESHKLYFYDIFLRWFFYLFIDDYIIILDNSVSFESGFGRFVPVRPQPRVLPLTVQNRESLAADHHEDNATSSSQNLHPFAHQMQNGNFF